MKERIESLTESLKDQKKHQLLLKREKDELQVMNSALESRISDALLKADMVARLEIDNKRMAEKEVAFLRQFDEAKKEIDSLRDKEKDLKKKVEELESNPIVANKNYPGTRKNQAPI
jgi:phage shock protein A